MALFLLGILDLPPEVREPVYCYCSFNDIRNLACCSKSYYNSVKHLLWQEVNIPWEILNEYRTLPEGLEKNLKFTRRISFFESDDVYLCTLNRWHQVTVNYKRILNSCNANILTQLKIHGVFHNYGFKFTCEVLPNLQELTFSSAYYNSNVSLNHLSSLVHLKKLTLEGWSVLDSPLEKIIKSQTLVELNFIDCKLLAMGTLERISNLQYLKKLGIPNNGNLNWVELMHLGNLTHLIELNFEGSTFINDDGLWSICQNIRNLRNLNIRRCMNVTDFGLIHLSNMSLNQLNVQYIVFRSKSLEDFCKLTGMKEMIKPHWLILTRDKHLWMKDGRCGWSWECNCVS